MGFFLREWVNRKVQTRRNVRNLTYFSRESESTHDLHLLDTSKKHLSVVKHKNHGQLCQYILQKVIKVLEAQNCTWIEYGGFYVFFSPSKKGVCVLSQHLLLDSATHKQQRTKKSSLWLLWVCFMESRRQPDEQMSKYFIWVSQLCWVT